MNNPVNFTDPTGMAPEGVGDGDPEKKMGKLELFYNNSGYKRSVDWFKSVLKPSTAQEAPRVNTDGGTNFYSKNGGGEGTKTTGNPDEAINGDPILQAAGFAGAPVKGKRNGMTDASLPNVVSNTKQKLELFKEGMDAPQSVEKANKAVNDLRSKTTQYKDTIFSVTGYSKADVSNQAHPSLNPVGIKNAESVSKNLLQFDGIDSISIKIKEIK